MRFVNSMVPSSGYRLKLLNCNSSLTPCSGCPERSMMRLRSPVLTGGAPRICTQMQTNLLTTDHVRPAERAGYWSDIIWRSFGKLRSDTWGDENFNGSI